MRCFPLRPAAVLASMCIKDVYVLQATPPAAMKQWDADNKMARSRTWRTLRYAYLLLMVLSFSLEISTIFISTQVSTRLATFTFVDSDASISLVDFLVREFEFEYSAVRTHFLSGLLSYTVAQALRVRYALRKYRMLSISGMCCLLTAASGMLMYTNANTITYGGFPSLLRRNMALTLRFLLTNVSRGPMGVITIVCLMLTIVFALRGWFAPEFVDTRYGISDVESK
mmetsp:Transcript_19205/g.38751  ORF Transcript_19205/g.38751 Transcript_19205/m.38751 type:complete len:227 (-) Transcript_19205:1257-1937(-)